MIEIANWRPFLIGKEFKISRPAERSVKKYSDGNVPFVSSGHYNNGIVGYLEKKRDDDFEDGNCITVSPVDGWAFYQKMPFLGRGGAGSSIIILRNEKLNEMRGLFVCSVIRRVCANWFYSDMGGEEALKDTVIQLPSTPNGLPDWMYMDLFMKRFMDESEKRLKWLGRKNLTKNYVDVRLWSEFRIADLFEVHKGSRLTKANMKEGRIKFIGSSSMNNGETARVSNSECLHPANTISVCYNGSVGETFYQEEEYWASDDVNVLYPLFKLTRNIALFICPIIKSLGQKYAFVNKWKKEVMENTLIKLPVTTTSEPDWAYMESYMQHIMDDSEKRIDFLKSKISESVA